MQSLNIPQGRRHDLACLGRLAVDLYAQQVGARIDWKYALALPLTDPGIDASALVDFRARLSTGNAEWVLFEALLERVREEG